MESYPQFFRLRPYCAPVHAGREPAPRKGHRRRHGSTRSPPSAREIVADAVRVGGGDHGGGDHVAPVAAPVRPAPADGPGGQHGAGDAGLFRSRRAPRLQPRRRRADLDPLRRDAGRRGGAHGRRARRGQGGGHADVAGLQPAKPQGGPEPGGRHRAPGQRRRRARATAGPDLTHRPGQATDPDHGARRLDAAARAGGIGARRAPRGHRPGVRLAVHLRRRSGRDAVPDRAGGQAVRAQAGLRARHPARRHLQAGVRPQGDRKRPHGRGGQPALCRDRDARRRRPLLRLPAQGQRRDRVFR